MKVPIAQPVTGEEECRAAEKVIRSGMLAQGPVVAEFEKKFAAYCGTKHAIAVNNGTAALHAALHGAGVGPGDEVIVPSFSFIASATCVNMSGAVPVFVDVDEKTFNISPEEVAAAITPRTKAVIGVHLFGQPVDLHPVMRTCEQEGIALIEDAAQAHGALYRGQRVGSFGAAGCFSFYPTKNMTTGEGGMVTTEDDELAAKVRVFINHGQSRKYHHATLGYNYRMTDVAAAIGLVQLGRLDGFNITRNYNARFLDSRIRAPGIETPVARPDVYHVFHQYVVKVTGEFPMERSVLMELLASKEIGSAVHYPTPIHRQPLYASMNPEAICPVSGRLAGQVLSLPVHPLVVDEQLEFICETINEVT